MPHIENLDVAPTLETLEEKRRDFDRRWSGGPRPWEEGEYAQDLAEHNDDMLSEAWHLEYALTEIEKMLHGLTTDDFASPAGRILGRLFPSVAVRASKAA